MKRKILQKIADLIIKNLELAIEAEDNDAFEFFLNIGYKLDTYCVLALNIYLD
jgi:hypothetical protein